MARMNAGERRSVRDERSDHRRGKARKALRYSKISGRPRLSPRHEHLAKSVMRAQISDSVAIADIARICGLSVSHFVRAFTMTVGQAPYDWFLEQRIKRAQELLASPELALAQIALDCGFSDQSHFTNTFVRRVGTTPYRWRRSRISREALVVNKVE